MKNLSARMKQARETSWSNLGKKITFFLPGMFVYNGITGRYPAVSVTGDQCALECDHCRAKILQPMVPATEKDDLLKACLTLEHKGNLGVLISGGCDEQGRLPWDRVLPAIKEIKRQTGLYISIHSGLVDEETALRLKEAGVDQALIDVIGDEDTFRSVYHVDFGIDRIESSMAAMQRAGLPMAPHVVCGLHRGEIRGERRAIDIISRFEVEQVVIVSLMKTPGTPSWDWPEPEDRDIVEILLQARLKMPRTRISLGCARARGHDDLAVMAVDAGVNRMALPSGEAVQRALDYGMEIRYQKTCCSVSADFSKTQW
ncbi:MAG: radical SAM protein [Deltaproteobacteria bacterium]|nr:radical SAM protein [Deltaproteobacteria bacterium]